MRQAAGTAVETTGAKTDVAFGIGNTVKTAADEEAAVKAAITNRAGNADKANALKAVNDAMNNAAASAA